METKLLIVLELVCLTVAQGQKKVCFAPVACSAGDVTSSEWVEIESKSQCTDKYSEVIVPTQASITESRIKNLINESVAELRSELTNLLASKGDSDELRRLKSDVREMNNTLNQMNAQVQEKLSDIYKKLDMLNSTLANQKKQGTKNCSVPHSFYYKYKCYWLALQIKNDAQFSDAQSLCSKDGGEPGDVLDQGHYDMITELFWSNYNTTIHFWTGMKFNPSTNVTTNSDGSRSNFQKWYSSSHPDLALQSTGILIQIGGAKTNRNGMYNRPPSNPAYGALCQS